MRTWIAVSLAWCGCLTVCVNHPGLAAEPDDAAMPKIVAHRGASADAPENTLPAFELAWKQGADAIEGDFYLSGDGQIVCIHDKDTKRTAGTNLTVKETPLAELRKLDVGAWKGEKFRGTIIPTIAEVFATIPKGKGIYIEVKCGPEIMPQLLKELEAAGLKNQQIILISFNAEVVRQFKAARPELKAYWLVGVGKNEQGDLKPSLPAVLATLRRIGANGLSSSYNHISQSYIDEIQRAGYEYHVWTVDDPAVAERFRSWGAGSITTNRPAAIREALTTGDSN